MKAIFNKEIIDDQILKLDADDRALHYGDGLFETIIVGKNRINLLDYHYSRLAEGAEVLGILLPEYFTLTYLKGSISELVNLNQLSGTLRIKVQIWRSPGGLYEPSTNTCHILITIRSHLLTNTILKNVGIAQSVRNHPSPFSQFKTISALKYILASIEKHDKGYDDLVILDEKGRISELLYSNIFWIKKGIFYTPSLRTGCIKGVMRSYIVEKFMEKGIAFSEVNTPPAMLRDAEYVFATNAGGIVPIVEIDDIKYPIFSELHNMIDS
jgi:branched-subunit amino acid aminotransferase/4-amino-4-deoxychorismate lyase